MKTITLRNIPPVLLRRILQRARESNRSLAATVIALLKERFGLVPSREGSVYHDLDELAGRWTEEEAEVFDSALCEQRAIDPELWR